MMATYEIPPSGAPRETNGRVVILRQDGKWTPEGMLISPRKRSALLQAHGEMHATRPVTGYDVFGQRKHVCACGEGFTGPPNRVGCDACRASK